jgi:hypothetical protein
VADSTTSSDGGLSLLRQYGGVAGNGARLLDDTQWAKFTVDVATSLGVTVDKLGLSRPAYLDKLPPTQDERYPTRYDSSDDGLRTIVFDDRVKVVEGEDAGKIFRYMGKSGIFTPAVEDYRDKDLWQEVLTTKALPSVGSVGASKSIAVGGVVVRNLVDSGALARISDVMDLQAGSVAVTAMASARLIADLDSFVSSGADSAFGNDKSIAINGVMAVNEVLGGAEALLRDSAVTAFAGDVRVRATNVSTLQATNKSLTQATGTGVAAGAMLAFNSMGWQQQGLISSTIDALLGSDIGDRQAAGAMAQVLKSDVRAQGDVEVSASQSAKFSVNVSNDATSAASALVNAQGAAAGLVLAQNRVASFATAEAVESDLRADEDVVVQAYELAAFDANIHMKSMSTTTNDGGASLLGGLVDKLIEGYEYTTRSGVQKLKTGDLVYVASLERSAGAERDGI